MPVLEAVPPQIQDASIDIDKERVPVPSKPVIGIIYPPPEVRNIVDKTASFVARNGPEFENRIRQNEVNNPKFNFLSDTDAYHAYYQHKVKEFKEGRGQEPSAPKPGFQALARQIQEHAIKLPEVFVPKDPPAEFEFIVDPPSIAAHDLDVVKLTAQFVARNGRQFLTTVMQREQRNYLFDFLRPQHSLFNYFTKLVEQYTKILIPPKNLREKLAKDCDSYKHVLEQVKYRVEWARHQDREKRKEEEAQEKERVSYASVDWHDFVVVETVDFQPNEQGNLPPPTTPDEVGARMLQQERLAKKPDPDEMDVESDDEEDSEPGSPKPAEIEPPPKLPPPPKDNRQLQDMEEGSAGDSSDEDDVEIIPPPRRGPAPPPPPPPPPSEVPPMPPTPGSVVIKKNYDPKARTVAAEQPSDQFMISPITGEKIPTDKVPEHMRIGLLNPKWIEDRQRTLEEKREQEEVYAAGSSIDINLKQLAERRTDIFGIGTEETQIGKKIGEEEQKDRKIVWDGHTASMEKVSQKARENISIEEQIATIHKVKGLLPDEEKEKIGPSMPKNAPPMPKPRPPPPSIPPPPRPPTQSQPTPPMMLQPNVMVLQPRPPMPIIGIPAPPPMVRQPMAMPNPPRFNRPSAPPAPKPAEDEPPSKKAKTEDNLIPEDIFLKKHKGPVKIFVSVPNVTDKPEWSLTGQKLDFTLPLTDSVSVIKAKLHESLGMPAGKQKLQFDGIFIKDSNTLAFYNFTNGAVIDLQVKERGGRKK